MKTDAMTWEQEAELYRLLQLYRHCPITEQYNAQQYFEAIKDYINELLLGPITLAPTKIIKAVKIKKN